MPHQQENKKLIEKQYDLRNMKELEKHIGYEFKEKGLLVKSLRIIKKE